MGKFRAERFYLRDKRVDEIKKLLDQGIDVGLLDNGNPCLFGPSQMFSEQFDPQDVVIIPGMSSDAAAMAVLGKSLIPAFDARMVVQSSPMLMLGPGMRDFQILKDLSKYQPNLVLYMALGNPERLFSVLGEIFPEDRPCAVVFWAGYSEKQKVVRGTIADMGDKLMNEKERYMGLLFIGDFLEGKPYESALK
jgi:precorrin-4 methylase